MKNLKNNWFTFVEMLVWIALSVIIMVWVWVFVTSWMKNITLQEISQPSIFSAAAFVNLFISKSKEDLNLLYIEALETLVKELRAQLEEKES